MVDVNTLAPSREAEALFASGVLVYMVVPMIVGGQLIGSVSFGSEQAQFPDEQVSIAQEVATQLAIAIVQARLLEQVKRQAVELEGRVEERTRELDMQYHDRIFGIFERLHRQEDYPGTGVGLAIVRKVAERHGGRAWAESTPGQGSTFFLALPDPVAAVRSR